MNAKAEKNPASALDSFKLLIAIAIFVGGLFGFYYFENEYATWMRIIGLLATFGIGLLIAYTTQKGHALWNFMQAANVERQKVVWPTRTETTQTTLIILVVVIIIGIMLWLVDMFYAYLVRLLVG